LGKTFPHGTYAIAGVHALIKHEKNAKKVIFFQLFRISAKLLPGCLMDDREAFWSGFLERKGALLPGLPHW
jgi:hypothetical protein